MKFKAIKRIFCGILSAVMSLTLLPQIPVSAKTGSTTYTFDGYKVEYSVMNEWDKNQNIGITITNTGKETIENWAIKYDASGEISNLWNGKINKKDGTSYIIENAGYNSDIKPNQTVNFGYQLTSEKPAVPSSYSFCMKRVPKTEGYTVTFGETSGYGSDVTGNITITNTTDKPIKAWELTFESDFTINNVWNAKLISSENGKFVIKNAEDTSVIQPNSSVTFGLQCKKTSEIKTNNAALSEVIVSDAADEPTEELLIFAYGEYNKETSSMVLTWESSVPHGKFDVLTSSDGKDYISAVQLNDSDTYSYAVDGTSEKIYFKIKETTSNNKTAESYPFIMAKTADGYELQLEDTDKDGLPDIYEEELGTDILKPDTDGDGLTDYQELYLTGTDPLKVDTDTNGINDGDEDTDKDGLTALEEIALGTDLSSADTDNDGLNDGNEFNNYRTDPLKVDTDEDKMNDSLEIKYNTIPNNPDTNGNGILDGDEIYKVNQTYSDSSALVKPTITIGLRGEQIDSFAIEQISTDDILLGDSIPGYIGNAYDFSVDGTFDKAVLSFEFPSELLNDPTYIPAIYYYNEETGFLEELDNQTISANTVSAEIKHFSNYMVLNKTNFDKAWDVEISAPAENENNGLNVVFVTDISLSMAENDPSSIRNAVTIEFIDKLKEKDSAALVTFTRVAETRASLTTNKEQVIAAVNKIVNDNGYNENYSGTDGSVGIKAALNMLNSNSNKKNFIVFFTDGGDSHHTYNYNDLINTAKANNISIYTVGLGNSVNDRVLSSLATSTGGKYFNAANANELIEEFAKIEKETIDRYTDSDLDGISDYHEKKLASGEMRLGTGATLSSKFTPSMKNLDYMNPDSDQDDLIDGEELKIDKYITKNKKTIYYCKMNSHPLLEDSDGDGLLDGKVQEYNGKIIAPQDKKNPLKSDGPKGVWKEHINQMKTATVPTELENWYGETNPDTSNTGVDGISAFEEEFDKLEQEGKIKFTAKSKYKISIWVSLCVSTGANLNNINNMNESNPNIVISEVAFAMAMAEIKKCIVNKEDTNYILTSLGSRMLNMKSDSKGNLHSQFYMWQAVGGFNNTYDAFFRTYTDENMRREKFPFTIDKTDYILWIWRGDYLNLGAGSEIGIYSRPTRSSDSLDHYFADYSLAMPMNLNLYNYNGEKNIDCIYNWAPTPNNPQWWITGFNPEYVGNVDVTKHVMIGSVDFSKFTDNSGKNEMYEALEKTSYLEEKNYNKATKYYTVFDDENHTVWLCWCEEELVK